MLQDVGAQRGVHFVPAAQVSGGFVQQVAVAGGQQVAHQDHRRAHEHEDEELARPALIHVLSALQNTHTANGDRMVNHSGDGNL